ncbi:MAG: thioredoxin family protein [Magnetovibrionaceae bacterium]
MTLTRRKLLNRAATGLLGGALGGLAAFGPGGLIRPSAAKAATIGEDGLHKQDWFLDSFMILEEDIMDAAAEGKRFAVMFEQRGCPYCKQMHEVNLTDDTVVSYIQEHFSVLQLNIWGDREVTDLDGETMSEKDLARRWRVNFTPTTVFFPETLDGLSGSGRDLEVARMPGYFNPAPFLKMFQYVAEKAYEEDSFQRYLQNSSG